MLVKPQKYIAFFHMHQLRRTTSFSENSGQEPPDLQPWSDRRLAKNRSLCCVLVENATLTTGLGWCCWWQHSTRAVNLSGFCIGST